MAIDTFLLSFPNLAGVGEGVVTDTDKETLAGRTI